MKKNYLIIGFFSFTCILFVSCKQSTAPTTVITNGTAQGGVELFDSLGNQFHDASGVRVSVEGSSQFAMTGADGIFEIKGLPEGQIPIIFTKPGFAEVHNVVESKPGDPVGTYSIYPLFEINHLTPNIVIRPFEACYIHFNFRDTQIFSFEAGGHFIHIWVYDSVYEDFGIAQFSSRIMDAPNYAGQYAASVQFFFSDRDSISPQNPETYKFASDPMPVNATDGSASIYVYRDSLLYHGFTANSPIKCAAFVTGLRTQDIFYTDKVTEKKIYTGLGPYHSITANFTLP